MLNERSEGVWMVFVGDNAVERMAVNAGHVLLGMDRVRRLCPADEHLAATVQDIRPNACLWSG